jgi:hypothetical protein
MVSSHKVIDSELLLYFVTPNVRYFSLLIYRPVYGSGEYKLRSSNFPLYKTIHFSRVSNEDSRFYSYCLMIVFHTTLHHPTGRLGVAVAQSV